MSLKHETPEVLKTKLKEEVALIAKLKGDLTLAEQRLQDVIGAYILGAKLPQVGIRFDEDYNLIYGAATEGESTGEAEEVEVLEESQDESPVEMEVVASKSPQKKPKIR
jgi:hypothetical protein